MSRFTPPCSPRSHRGAPAGRGCGRAGGTQHGAGPAGLETGLPAGLGGPRVSRGTGYPLPMADAGPQHVCSPAALAFCDFLRVPVRVGDTGRAPWPGSHKWFSVCSSVHVCVRVHGPVTGCFCVRVHVAGVCLQWYPHTDIHVDVAALVCACACAQVAAHVGNVFRQFMSKFPGVHESVQCM